jgi:ABC-2 type transport system ATP-binding protein
MSKSAIVVRGLKKAFTRRRGLFKSNISTEWALKDISFEVGHGETYGLLGPNGSGKSTLIRVLATLLAPDEGNAEIFGHRIPGDEPLVRQKIGRVSVDAAFYKKLSARANLLYSALLYGLDYAGSERRAMEILEELGVDSRRFSDPLEEMSRGMQQKVSIARALLVDPPLLLLDEPTTGLDPRSRRDVHIFIEGLRRRRGTTIVLTTHDMAEAERLCDRIGFIAQGRLVGEGTAGELKQAAGCDTLEDTFLALSGCGISEPAALV